VTDPLTVSCPDCQARKGKGCTYLWPKDWDGSPRVRHDWLTPGILALMDRAGTPTKRPHNSRYQKAWAKEQADRYHARTAERAARNAAGRDREAILRANADAVAAEQRALMAWLRQHAHVLTGGSR
jgi:hypothetical protein